jgi:hypothetical protein
MSELVTPAPTAEVAAPSRPEAAAAVWQWRRAGVDDGEAGRRAAATQRRKGLVGGVVGAVVALIVWQWRPAMALVVLGIALLLTALALVSPLGAFRRVTAALEAFGRAVGVGLTWVLMTLVYYLLFLPVGLVLRARGRLRLRKRLEPGLPSYWTPLPDRPRTLDGYRRQF